MAPQLFIMGITMAPLACSSCHGLNFHGSPAIGAPALAGLPAAAILARLAHYAGPDGHTNKPILQESPISRFGNPKRDAISHILPK
jgi:mono/diheme cytochrome c family protein